MRKPDVAIFQLALDLAQTPPAQAIFIDNTEMFVQIAKRLGIRGLLHADFESTRSKLASFGLRTGKQVTA
jgi:putative hydrolase of the HAD superfamily